MGYFSRFFGEKLVAGDYLSKVPVVQGNEMHHLWLITRDPYFSLRHQEYTSSFSFLRVIISLCNLLWEKQSYSPVPLYLSFPSSFLWEKFMQSLPLTNSRKTDCLNVSVSLSSTIRAASQPQSASYPFIYVAWDRVHSVFQVATDACQTLWTVLLMPIFLGIIRGQRIRDS